MNKNRNEIYERFKSHLIQKEYIMIIEKIKNKDLAERMWPELFGTSTNNKPVELTNGEVLCNRFGKYQPNLCFVLNEEGAQLGWDDKIPNLNLEFDGDLDYIPGDFWVSKKGTHCFRPKKDGKHILLRVNWGGCFVSTRGCEYEEVKPLAIFSRRAGSNGGGTGYNFYIFDKNFHREVSIEDI